MPRETAPRTHPTAEREGRMTKFRKKPVEIEAVQWLGDSTVEAIRDLDSENRIIRFNRTLKIKTLEGTLTARHGDWIIRGVKGELYPCKPDIFDATYEPVT